MPRLVAIKDGKIANLAFGVNEEPSREEIDQALIAAWTAQYDSAALVSDVNARAEPGDDWTGTEGVESLVALRMRRIQAINQRTEVIIRVGFEFPPGSGQMFSMSDIAQFNLEVANGARDLPELTYPVLFSFIDDSGAYSCPNAATLHYMWLTALSLKRTALDSGRALKNAVTAAATAAELAAVEDTR